MSAGASDPGPCGAAVTPRAPSAESRSESPGRLPPRAPRCAAERPRGPASVGSRTSRRPRAQAPRGRGPARPPRGKPISEMSLLLRKHKNGDFSASHASLSEPRVTETPLIVDPTLPKLFRNRRAAGLPPASSPPGRGPQGPPPRGPAAGRCTPGTRTAAPEWTVRASGTLTRNTWTPPPPHPATPGRAGQCPRGCPVASTGPMTRRPATGQHGRRRAGALRASRPRLQVPARLEGAGLWDGHSVALRAERQVSDV